ncbi:hypothetical protein JW710_03760 [Candidatus Dojkabacteria bacterium]|nr:hypothetical protein [Candidatus Dojkabacteria bacterium]
MGGGNRDNIDSPGVDIVEAGGSSEVTAVSDSFVVDSATEVLNLAGELFRSSLSLVNTVLDRFDALCSRIMEKWDVRDMVNTGMSEEDAGTWVKSPEYKMRDAAFWGVLFGVATAGFAVSGLLVPAGFTGLATIGAVSKYMEQRDKRRQKQV